MLFAIYCLDKPNSLSLRMAMRPAHFEYVAKTEKLIRAGGPLLAEDNETMIGSLVIVEADNVEAALEWSDSDPYVKAGLFEKRDIKSFKWLVNNPHE